MTIVKDRQAVESANTPPADATDVKLEIKERQDVGAGMIEVTVRVDNQPAGSSFVLTSPRDFAFRKTA